MRARQSSRVPRVLLMMNISISTYRELLQGILRYSSERGHWAVHVIEGRPDEEKIATFEQNDYTGAIISYGTDPGLMQFVTSRRFPTIFLEATREQIAITRRRKNCGLIICDNAPIGEAAAKFLLSTGATNFAYVGDAPNSSWSQERAIAFRQTIESAGYPVSLYESNPLQIHKGTAENTLQEWLLNLPKPCALLAVNDIRARMIFGCCRTCGISIPDDISIISCDNDEFICETCNPSLTSIRFTTQAAGYHAAELLDQLMKGHARIPLSERYVHYGFSEIIERNSTKRSASGDIAFRVMGKLKKDALSRLTISSLAKSLNVSRRYLETKFKNATGATIHDRILHIRLERAKVLLTENSRTITEIADECGFCSPSHFSSTFRRLVGCSPMEYKAAGRPAWISIRKPLPSSEEKPHQSSKMRPAS